MDLKGVPLRCVLCRLRFETREDQIRHTFAHELAEKTGQTVPEAEEGLEHLLETGLARIEGTDLVLPRPRAGSR